MAALSFDDQLTFLADADLLTKVGQAMLRVAKGVRIEGASVDHHALRADLAVRVWEEQDLWAYSFLKGAADDDDMTLSPTDEVLIAAVENAWNEAAGAPGPAGGA